MQHKTTIQNYIQQQGENTKLRGDQAHCNDYATSEQ